jgi:predicted kinase
MPTCYQLIGVPGSGKSTWANAQDWTKDFAYVSTDRYVEAQALLLGKTYNEVFKEAMTEAIPAMVADVKKAIAEGKNIMWDQTSTTIKSRRRKFKLLPTYTHVAVVFAIPESAELERRLASRPGKSIPWEVVDSMVTGFAMPTNDEGFAEIWNA